MKKNTDARVNLTFVDPPFNQGKDYRYFDDLRPEREYWNWLKEVLSNVYEITVNGGTVYFMQREKNTEQVLRVVRETGWVFQNLIIWKKKTSAVPCGFRFSKQYQIIVFASKGEKPNVFNKLRIDLPMSAGHRHQRENGVLVSDVWDDIREMTSGYFAGDEALRDADGNRLHTQQSPIALLLRIILISTMPGDVVLDPFAGTGTTLVVANQLGRESVSIEIDPEYVKVIKSRLKYARAADNILRYFNYYRYTPDIDGIWPGGKPVIAEQGRLF
ncbi:MAG: site-specific DNA-methyltransferase [bacterium]